MEKFTAVGVRSDGVAEILQRTTILTRAFCSDDDATPGKIIREKIKNLLVSPSYWLTKNLDDAFNAIWTFVYDCAAQARTITSNEVEKAFREIAGVHVRPQAWRQFPLPTRFIPRLGLTGRLQELLSIKPILFLFGVAGAGKSALLSQLANDLYNSGRIVCWISIDPITTMFDLQKTLSACLLYFGQENVGGFKFRSEHPDEASGSRVVVWQCNDVS